MKIKQDNQKECKAFYVNLYGHCGKINIQGVNAFRPEMLAGNIARAFISIKTKLGGI